MRRNTASFTAEMMALYRAMETSRPPSTRILTDPYASLFLNRRFRLASWMAAFAAGERWLYGYMQRRIPGALASAIARTRYIDDILGRRLNDGARQVILLGAGFDTRAMRLATLQTVDVLEIDHPDTARRKKECLIKAAGQLPANVRYLSADLNLQSPTELIIKWKIDRSVPTVIIWEGVTNYLEQKSVENCLRLIATFPPGSSIIFTYVDRGVLDHPAAWYGAERLLADLERVQEKWTWGFLPDEMPAWLIKLGLRLVVDKGAAEYREMYLSERKTILKGYEFYHVAEAVAV